ncbi:MAG TPA: lipoyl(octanoyl) transferase LipB [Pseudonocardiaceae bacterium]|nr:lipoyl(octanoyl) transferase LipB [Pseudonocardiaceae bacterium]
MSCRASAEPMDVRLLGTVAYAPTWDLQRELAAARADETGRDTLLLLEHHSVYTAGKRTEPDDMPQDGSPVIDVDRGGKITWHGPGQLVGYPIVRLANPIDVVNYVRRVEEAMIAVCDAVGLTAAGRVDGRSGVWLPADGERPERKIAALGIRVQREVTMHGFEINCDADLSHFDQIIPCGIRDAGVTSLSAELGRRVTVAEVLPIARDAVQAALDGQLPVTERLIVRPAAPTVPGVTFQLAQ